MVAFNNAGGDGANTREPFEDPATTRERQRAEVNDLALSYLERLTTAIDDSRKLKAAAADLKVVASAPIPESILQNPDNSGVVELLHHHQLTTQHAADLATANAVLLESWLQSSRNVIRSLNEMLNHKPV